MHYDEREKVNHLIEHLKDGEAGYLAAAQDAVNPLLKETWMAYAARRAEYAEALQLLVEESGEKAEYTGTMGGALHRGWMNLKGSMAKRTDEAILKECEAAEDLTLAAYRRAQEGGQLEVTGALVAEQAMHLAQEHDRAKRLRDSTPEV
jgi:uncharacterized protein (TIGR02284 family)